MGYYEGQRSNPCPRCGGIVATLFVSVGPMSFEQWCQRCGTAEFTPEEEALLGEPYQEAAGWAVSSSVVPFEKPNEVTTG